MSERQDALRNERMQLLAAMVQDLRKQLLTIRADTLHEAAEHLRAAMDDVERLSPEFAARLTTADVRRLADELEAKAKDEGND